VEFLSANVVVISTSLVGAIFGEVAHWWLPRRGERRLMAPVRAGLSSSAPTALLLSRLQHTSREA